MNKQVQMVTWVQSDCEEQTILTTAYQLPYGVFFVVEVREQEAQLYRGDPA